MVAVPWLAAVVDTACAGAKLLLACASILVAETFAVVFLTMAKPKDGVVVKLYTAKLPVVASPLVFQARPLLKGGKVKLLNQPLGITRNTFYVGLGGRVRIRPTVYVSAEVSPRLAGLASDKPEYGFAIEKRAGAHVFQLNFTNSSGTTFAQTAQGGLPDSLYLGFNLTRKFF